MERPSVTPDDVMRNPAWAAWHINRMESHVQKIDQFARELADAMSRLSCVRVNERDSPLGHLITVTYPGLEISCVISTLEAAYSRMADGEIKNRIIKEAISKIVEAAYESTIKAIKEREGRG